MRSFVYLIYLACSMLLVACGGGGGGSGSATATTSPVIQNVQTVVIDGGPNTSSGQTAHVVNSLYTTVTICQPGSNTQCQTIGPLE